MDPFVENATKRMEKVQQLFITAMEPLLEMAKAAGEDLEAADEVGAKNRSAQNIMHLTIGISLLSGLKAVESTLASVLIELAVMRQLLQGGRVLTEMPKPGETTQ